MHVIGHDYPGMKGISLAIEKQERFLYNLRNSWILEPRSAMPLIEQLIEISHPLSIRSGFIR